ARSGHHQLVFVQIFLVVTLLAALTLSVEVADRQHAERVLRETEVEQSRKDLELATTTLQERKRIVRDTHDIVGHALNVILLQTAAARRATSNDPDGATKLLQSVEEVGRGAFEE